MTSEEEIHTVLADYVPTAIAGIFFVIQFFMFMYDFNFLGVPTLALAGWLLLIPGFLLITLSKSALKDTASKEEGGEWIHTPVILKLRGNRLLHHPFLVGWFMMSIALAMISQNWISIFCMGVQLPLIVFVIYNRTISSENDNTNQDD